VAYAFKDEDVICSCTRLTKKQFLVAIKDQQIASLDQAREKTGVNVACGMCIYIVEKLLTDSLSSQ
jgi:NAD(P)H-nitrite reductase large subunit